MNTDNLLIENSDIEVAQNICKIITDTNIRNRAVANALAAILAAKYFDNNNLDIDTTSGLHNISKVLEDIDISDLYVNKCYIDVRLFFNEEEMAVPIEHFKDNLLPVAYMFIKINPELSGAEILGFLKPENINKSKIVNNYYKVSEEELESFYEIEHLLSEYTEESYVNDKDIFDYIDNKLENIPTFYAELLHSKDARLKLLKAIKANEVFKFISVNKQIENQENQENKEIQQEDFSDNMELFNEIDSVQPLNEELNLELNDDNLSIDDSELIVDSNADMLNELEVNNDELMLSDNNITQESMNNSELEELNENNEFEQDIEISTVDEELSSAFENNIIEKDEISETPFVQEDLTNNPNTDTAENSNNKELLPDEHGIKDGSDDFNQFTTVATPSEQTNDFILDEMLTDEKETDTTNLQTDTTQAASEEQIETLFNNYDSENITNSEAEIKPVTSENTKKGVSKPILALVLIALLGTSAFFSFSKLNNSSESLPENDVVSNESQSKISTTKIQSEPVQEAMPNEAVDINLIPKKQDEGVATSIPAIEHNLDASILVSNLKVDWEVPSGYAANTAAKRYLIKLGKIIQLNLKTELLLLNKPPISNKITVEIKYNSSTKKFEATEITVSSGEKVVDDVILQTVKKALSMNLNSNTDSFAKLQGNPVLIIHL